MNNKMFPYLAIFFILVGLSGCGGSSEKNSKPIIEEDITVGTTPKEIQTLFGADSSKEDTDDDGLADDFEIIELYPFALPDSADTDSNNVSDADEDFDNDTLTNIQEMEYGTNPLQPDSDDDGLDDATEILELKTDPLREDTDNDGLADLQELIFNTDPLSPDTDNDGILDGEDSHTAKISDENDIVSFEVAVNQKEYGSLYISSDISSIESGQLTHSYELITDSELSEAQISFKLSPEIATDISLRVFAYDNNVEFWIPAASDEEAQIFDKENNLIITFKGSTNTKYAIFDINKWQSKSADIKSSQILFNQKSSVQNSNISALPEPYAVWNFDDCSVKDKYGRLNGEIVGDIDCKNIEDNDYIGEKGLFFYNYDTSNYIKINLGENVPNEYTFMFKVKDVSYGGHFFRPSFLGSEFYFWPLIEQSRQVFIIQGGDQRKLSAFGGGLGNITQTNSPLSNPLLLRGDLDYRDGDNQTGFTHFKGIISKIVMYNHFLTQHQVEILYDRELEGSITPINDSDYDGISDEEESNIQLSDRKIATNYLEADTDGDGLLDGPYNYHAINSSDYNKNEKGFGELSKLISNNNVENQMFYKSGEKIPLSIPSFRRMYSDPTKEDSDNDGLSDLDEFKWGTNPFYPDTDHDGLSDAVELISDLDPTNHDTDGDTHLDGVELEHNSSGVFDPYIYTKLYTKAEYASEFTKGLIAGDWVEIDTVPEISGSIASGLIAVGDVRDLVANLTKGEFVSASINLVGVIPAAGDYTSAVALIVKAAKKSKSPSALIKQTLKANPLGDKWVKLIAEELYGESFKFVSAKIPEDALMVMVRNGQDINKLSASIKAAETSLGVSKITKNSSMTRDGFIASLGDFKHWQNGERYVAQFVSGSTTLKRKTLKAEIPECIGKNKNCQNRFLDYYDSATHTGYEAKTGYVKDTSRIRKQIKKDCHTLNNNQLNDMVWHFMPSDVSASVGFDESLIELMKCGGKRGIKYQIHLP